MNYPDKGVESAPMFDIGGGEFLLLVILGLLVFGPRRLPQLGRQFGGFVAQMRKAMNEFRGTLEREVALDEVRDAAKQVAGLTQDAEQMTKDLLTGVGPPEPADPTRRLRRGRQSAGKEEGGSSSSGEAAEEPVVHEPPLGGDQEPAEGAAKEAPGEGSSAEDPPRDEAPGGSSR